MSRRVVPPTSLAPGRRLEREARPVSSANGKVGHTELATAGFFSRAITRWNRWPKIAKFGAPALLVAAVVVIAFFRHRGGGTTAWTTAKIDRGGITQTVLSSGTLNPIVLVQVGSQVSGTIQALGADWNSQVKKGQMVARIDSRLYEATLAQAKATLLKARVDAENARRAYERAKTVYQQNLIAQQDLDNAEATWKDSTASVAQAEASVQTAQTNVDYCTIRAPIDGVVVARQVDIGQTVASALSAPNLFQVAKDLTKMQIDASVDESDIGGVHEDMSVSFNVDAYPNDHFPGKVFQVRLNPQVQSNVVTYDVVIYVDNPDGKLLPGMTANLTITTAERKDALRAPNSALRFKPPNDVLTKIWAERRAAMRTSGQGEGRLREGGGGGGQWAGGGGAGAMGAGSPGGLARMMDDPQAMLSFLRRAGRSVVFVPDGGSLKPVVIRTGVNDGTYTEVVEVVRGNLDEGTLVATGMAETGARSAATPSGPASRPMFR